MNSLYQIEETIKSLGAYFEIYRNAGLTKPAFKKYFLLVLSILSFVHVPSINFLYQWFLSKVDDKHRNSYYEFLKANHSFLPALERITLIIALSVIPQICTGNPILIAIDDTVQPKFGMKFENVGKLHDHAAHNGKSFVNGHCFVCLIVKIPVILPGETTPSYLSVPISSRQYAKDGASKYKIAAGLIDAVMAVLPGDRQAILLCDSWYPKGDVILCVKRTPNLEMIAAVRKDTVLYGLPPKKTGKRGRPRKHGERLDPSHDFVFKAKHGDYHYALRVCMTNLFDEKVYVTATTKNPEAEDLSYRLYLSTINPQDISKIFQEEDAPESMCYRNYSAYRHRWSIETLFYEQKTFWSFGDYKLRSQAGVEMYHHLMFVAYACMVLLPLVDQKFEHLQSMSILERKTYLGQRIIGVLFLEGFGVSVENQLNHAVILKAFA